MMIIIMNGSLLSQTLTDSATKQHEEQQIVKDSGGCWMLYLQDIVFLHI